MDPKKLAITVREGGRQRERVYYEYHRARGVQLKAKYRAGNDGAKRVTG